MRAWHDADIIVVLVATITTMIMLGLGYVARPRRTTRLWSMAFLLVTIAAIGAVIGLEIDVPALVDFSTGLALGAPALVWSGLRVDRGARAHAWLAPVQSLLSATTLLVFSERPSEALVYALLYMWFALSAGMAIPELLRRPERGGGRLAPLTLVSAAVLTIGFAGVVTALVAPDGDASPLAAPDLKAAGLVVYLLCALVSLLAIAWGSTSTGESATLDLFTRIAADRLRRARAGKETDWSILVVALDDANDLRAAAGETAFQRILDRFESDVRASFPARADIGIDGAIAHVLVHDVDIAVRDQLGTVRERLSLLTDDQPLALEFSASIGWASTADFGYDLERATEAASRAVHRAADPGGAGWERATP